jgi:hypothetical protein
MHLQYSAVYYFIFIYFYFKNVILLSFQDVLELLCSSEPPASVFQVARTTGTCNHPQMEVLETFLL